MDTMEVNITIPRRQDPGGHDRSNICARAARWIIGRRNMEEDDEEEPLPPLAITSSLGALGPVLGKLNYSLLDPKHRLPRGIHKEEIMAFKSHLESAHDSVKNLSEQDYVSIRDMYWMKEVRDLSYDAQDYLDMARHYSVGGLLERCVLTILKPQRHHLIARDISHLTSRLIDASDRYRALLNKLDRKKAEPDDPEDREKSVTKQQSEIEEDVKTHTKQSDIGVVVKTVTKQSEMEVADIKHSEIEETVKLLPTQLSEVDYYKVISLLAFDTEQQLKVVPILGTAGVGKTTLARRLYHSYGGRFQCRAFICVSRRPTIETLLASMLSQIKGPQSKGSYDVEILMDKIKQHLRAKSLLGFVRRRFCFM